MALLSILLLLLALFAGLHWDKANGVQEEPVLSVTVQVLAV